VAREGQSRCGGSIIEPQLPQQKVTNSYARYSGLFSLLNISRVLAYPSHSKLLQRRTRERAEGFKSKEIKLSPSSYIKRRAARVRYTLERPCQPCHATFYLGGEKKYIEV
jgi:hypothetical protein